MELKIDITGVDQLKNRLAGADMVIDDELQKVVNKTAFTIERQAKINAPVVTGFLRSSINVPATSLNPLTGQVIVRARYGQTVNRRPGRGHRFFTKAVERGREQAKVFLRQAEQQIVRRLRG